MTAETIIEDLMYEEYCTLKNRLEVWGFLTAEEQEKFNYLQSMFSCIG